MLAASLFFLYLMQHQDVKLWKVKEKPVKISIPTECMTDDRNAFCLKRNKKPNHFLINWVEIWG